MTGEIKSLNRDTYGDFFVTYFNELFAYANVILWDEAKSEDIVQDVFLKYWENRERLVVKDSLLSYFYSAVRNRCYSYMEHQKVEQRGVSLLKREHVDEYPEEEDDERKERIHRALDELPLQCRRIVVLTCIEGMKYQDVARELGVSVNTVKTQVHRGFTQLRRSLDTRTMLLLLLNLPPF